MDVTTRILGWRAPLIHGDPCVLDRWLWVRSHLEAGTRRTFDAGCGNGAFSIYASKLGNEVVGASFSDEELARAARRAHQVGAPVDLRVIDLRYLEQDLRELGTFDQILCLETIEHIRDDARVLQNLAAMLTPGGQLLVTAPYDRHRPLLGEDADPNPVEDGSHVRYGYTHDHLAAMLGDAGLIVTEQTFTSGVISQRVTNVMRRLRRYVGTPVAWLLVLPLRLLVVLDRRATRRLGYPYLSVAVRAVRPA